MLSIEKPCGRFTNATAIASAIFFASSTFIFPPRPRTQAVQKSICRDAPTKPTRKPFHGFSKSPRRAAPACRGYRSGISRRAPGGNAARKAGQIAFQTQPHFVLDCLRFPLNCCFCFCCSCCFCCFCCFFCCCLFTLCNV